MMCVSSEPTVNEVYDPAVSRIFFPLQCFFLQRWLSLPCLNNEIQYNVTPNMTYFLSMYIYNNVTHYDHVCVCAGVGEETDQGDQPPQERARHA